MGLLFPYISKHSENELYASKSIKYGVLFIFPIALVIASIPDAFISLMFPLEYLKGATALAIVAIGMAFLVLIIVFANIFQARNAPRIPAIVLSLAVIVEIISLVILVPLHGIIGAAISTTIACSLGCIVLVWFYLHIYEFKLDSPAILKTLLSFCILLLTIHIIPHKGSLLLIADLFLSAIIYFVMLAFFNLLTEDDLSIFLDGLPDHKNINQLAEIVRGIVSKLNRV
jgi:O-antigen/teichoic acid export membrane protein